MREPPKYEFFSPLPLQEAGNEDSPNEFLHRGVNFHRLLAAVSFEIRRWRPNLNG